MHNGAIRKAANVVAVVATLGINALANVLPLNGLTTGEISDRFKAYFTPAGYVFSIWSLIYLGLIAFAVYQALPAQRSNPRLARVGYLFALSCVANVGWLFLWHYEQFPLTLIAMFALLVSLIAIYLRLGIGRAAVSPSERWLVHVTFSIYLAWVTVATIANVTITLEYLNWDGWGIAPQVWAVTMLVVGLGIGVAVTWTRGDVAFVLVLVWAYAGIAIKQSTSPLVANAAWATATLLVLLAVLSALRIRRHGHTLAPT